MFGQCYDTYLGTLTTLSLGNGYAINLNTFYKSACSYDSTQLLMFGSLRCKMNIFAWHCSVHCVTAMIFSLYDVADVRSSHFALMVVAP